MRVTAELALRDHATLVSVHELNRILDGDDPSGRMLIEMLDTRGQGGGFSTAGRTGDQNQPAAGEGQRLADGRELERVDRRHRLVDGAKGQTNRAALDAGVNAEPTQPLSGIGENQFPI